MTTARYQGTVRQRSARSSRPPRRARRFNFIVSIGLITAQLSYRRSNSRCRGYEGILRCAWTLEIFSGARTIAPPKHRGHMHDKLGKFEKPEQKNADPDANHMRQVLHSPLNGRRSGGSRQKYDTGQSLCCGWLRIAVLVWSHPTGRI